MIHITEEALEHYKKYYSEIIDKQHMLDRITPFYKGVLDNLSTRSQKIIYILAERATEMSSGDLARKVKVESKNISVTLNQLFVKGLIKKKAVNEKNYVYCIDDKTFLDWAAMIWKFKRDWK
jgi:predicted transcriptional regulator